jgi:response regulator RpfG family c-di-GMP phosphodiesterase
MRRLLLVDDEVNVLNALRRELSADYDVELHTNPVEALARCRDIPFDLVIADYQMPLMTGTEFLRQFNALQPDAARMLLSGQADIDALLRLINETHIYLFLAKPWERMELLASIAQALAHRDALLANRANQPPAPRKDATGTPWRILLAESEDHAREVMKRGLEDGGGGFLYDALRDELPDARGQVRPLGVETVASAAAAMDCMRARDYDLVIASQALPDQRGIDLLAKLHGLRPQSALLLVAADPDKQLLARAINDVHVQGVLALRWTTHELKSDARRQMWNIYKLRSAVLSALVQRTLLLGARPD